MGDFINQCVYNIFHVLKKKTKKLINCKSYSAFGTQHSLYFLSYRIPLECFAVDFLMQLDSKKIS